MSITSALRARYTLWRDLLCADYGYDEQPPSRMPLTATEMAIRALRQPSGSAPGIALEVHEAWLPGPDPTLSLNLDGCWLVSSSWHAQIVPEAGERGAERLDVDRRKETGLLIHRHPLGQLNEVREPAWPLMHPDAWVDHVEQLILLHYPPACDRRSRCR